jgi:dTDP-4-amino-4,6-dideoxygalactose transaminase
MRPGSVGLSANRVIRELETRLANIAHRGHAVLLGHANTALYLALKYLRQTRGPGEIIVPPIVCSSVVQTIIYAGFEPVFVDVTLPLCTIDPEAAARAIGERTRAVVAVHIFGYSANVRALAKLSERHGLWLIEDAAQSIGGQISGSPHGQWGDVSLYSFGGTKIVAAGGGGAMLCDQGELHSYVLEEAAKLPPLVFDTRHKLLSLSHRNLIHGLMDALRVQRTAPVWKSFANLVDVYEPLYLHSFPDDGDLADRIMSALDGLPEDVQARQQRARRYHSGLADLTTVLQLPDMTACDGAVWRFTMLVSDDASAIRVTEALRSARLDASNHYWSVAHLLQGRRDFPNADFASPRLLNLWVDPRTDMDEVERAITVVRQELAGSVR